MELKRNITLFNAVMINLGAIIGAGIFVIIGLASFKAGPAIIISIILSATIAIFTGLSFSEIARHVSKEGGVYEYAKSVLSPMPGFIGGWMWTFGNIIGIAAVALSFGSYMDSLTGLNLNPVIFAIICILSFMSLNILGIKNSAKTITAIVIINLVVLVVFIFSGLSDFHSENFVNFMPHGISGVITGTALIFFAFTGFSRVTTISDEIINPEKTIPKAIIYSIVISSVLYILVAVTLLGLKPYYAYAVSSSPLALAIKSLHDYYLVILISIGGLTATAGVTLTGILGTSRVLFAMGRDDELPKKLSYIDKFSTPVIAIAVSAILGIIFLIFIYAPNQFFAFGFCHLCASLAFVLEFLLRLLFLTYSPADTAAIIITAAMIINKVSPPDFLALYFRYALLLKPAEELKADVEAPIVAFRYISELCFWSRLFVYVSIIGIMYVPGFSFGVDSKLRVNAVGESEAMLPRKVELEPIISMPLGGIGSNDNAVALVVPTFNSVPVIEKIPPIEGAVGKSVVSVSVMLI